MGAFRLALLLGRPVSELDITWNEFCYWMAFFELEPPEKGDNERTAALMAQITNMAGRSLPEKKFVDAHDFLGKPKKQTMEEQLAFMRSLNG